MRCRLCYTACTAEDRFCPHCGSPLNLPGAVIDDPPPFPKALPAPKKRPNFRRIFAVCAAVCLVLTLVGALSYVLTRPPRFGTETYACVLSESGLYGLDKDGGPLILSDEGISSVRYTPSGTSAAWMTESGTVGLSCEGNITIAGNAASYTLSFNGSAAAYVTTGGDLYWVDAATGKEVLVARDLPQLHYVVLSPDGDDLAYNDAEDMVWLSHRGGTPEPLVQGMVPILLSQNSEIFYLMDADGVCLYSLRDGVLTFLLNLYNSGQSLYTNRTGTELFYGSEDGLFLSQDGGPFRQLSDGFYHYVTPLLPDGCGAFAYYVITYDVSTLVGLPVSCLTLESNGLYDIQGYTTAFVRLEEDGAVPLAQCSGNAFCHLSADGNTFFYSDGPTLYTCAMTGESAPAEVLTVPQLEDHQILYAFFDDQDTPRFLWNGQTIYFSGAEGLTEASQTDQAPILDPTGQGVYVLQPGAGEGYTLTRWDWSGNAVDCCPDTAVSLPVSLLGDGVFFTDTEGKDWYLDPKGALTDLSRASHLNADQEEGM